MESSLLFLILADDFGISSLKQSFGTGSFFTNRSSFMGIWPPGQGIVQDLGRDRALQRITSENGRLIGIIKLTWRHWHNIRSLFVLRIHMNLITLLKSLSMRSVPVAYQFIMLIPPCGTLC